jgi:hypothetical protein
VFGRNKVEPPCGGFFQRLVYFEVARFGVRHLARAGVMGRPGRWSNGGCHIISGMEHMIVSLPRAARQRAARCPSTVVGRCPVQESSGSCVSGRTAAKRAAGNEQGAGSALRCGGSCRVCSCHRHGRRERCCGHVA